MPNSKRAFAGDWGAVHRAANRAATELFPTLTDGRIFLLYRGLNLSLLRGCARLCNPGKSVPGMRFIFDRILALVGFRKRLRGKRFSRGGCEFRHCHLRNEPERVLRRASVGKVYDAPRKQAVHLFKQVWW